MDKFTFGNGRVILREGHLDFARIDTGLYTGRSFDSIFTELEIDYSKIIDVNIREATLIRKGFIQIITDENKIKVKNVYQVWRSKNALLINDKSMNEVAYRMKEKIQSKCSG